MAGSVNKVILIGNLGKDPEIRRLASGDEMASFSLATSETWRDKNTGEKRERTEWHQVVVFNEALVKVIRDYVKKGMKVFIEGHMQTRKWEDQSGQTRYTTEVVLPRFRGEIQMLDSGGGGRPPAATGPDDYGTTQSRQGSYAEQSGGNPAGRGIANDLDDEIPF